MAAIDKQYIHKCGYGGYLNVFIINSSSFITRGPSQ